MVPALGTASEVMGCRATKNLLSMQRSRTTWVAFVRDCELFSEPYSCKQQESACVKPGSDPSQNNSTSQTTRPEGEGKRQAKAEGEAEVRPVSTHCCMCLFH